MNRRGFTLLELLIAIGLVMALGALVWPTMMKSQRSRIFDSTVEIVRDQLLLARAYAQASGKPVEVIYLSEHSRVEARLFEPVLRAMKEKGDGIIASAQHDEGSETFALDDEDLQESIIAEPWAYRNLADKVQVSNKPPQNDGDEQYGFEEFYDNDLLDLDQQSQPQIIRIAVFLADGSALLGDPVWIIDSDGRQGRITVNPWTGLAGYEQGAVYQNDFDLSEESDEDAPFDDFLNDNEPPLPTTQPPATGNSTSGAGGNGS